MVIISKIYRGLRLFSLDIVAGVIAGSFFAAHIFGTHLPWAYLAVIGMTVWLIYLADHVIDGVKKHGESGYAAHRLFYRYRSPVILLILVVGIFDFRLALYRLPPAVIQLGLITGGATFVYFMFTLISDRIDTVLFIKELWISAIYTVAVWGGPVIYAGNDAAPWQIMIMVSYGLLVMSNVLSYSYFEYDIDVADREHTFAVDFGRRSTRIVIYILIFASMVLWLGTELFTGEAGAAEMTVLGGMTAGMLALITFHSHFSRPDYYGSYADALFLLPFLVLIWN